MSGSSPSVPELDEVVALRVLFSRDRKLILVCSQCGLWIVSSLSLEVVGYVNGPVLLADIVPDTSLVGVVRLESEFELVDIAKPSADSCITHAPIQVNEPILSLCVSSKRVMLLTSSRLLIYDLLTLRRIESVDRISLIPSNGPSDATVSVSSILVFSDTGRVGTIMRGGSVMVMDSYSLRRFPEIVAHSRQPTAMDLHASGNLLATASAKGTLIRVFRFDEQRQRFDLVEVFRRGRTENLVHSLHFSEHELPYLTAIGSGCETAHVFKVSADITAISAPAPSNGPNISKSVLSMLPQQYKEAFEAKRDFAFVKLRKTTSSVGYASSSSLASVGGCVVRRMTSSVGSALPQVLVFNGVFAFVYELATAAGGECKLRQETVLVTFEQMEEKRGDMVNINRESRDILSEEKLFLGGTSSRGSVGLDCQLGGQLVGQFDNTLLDSSTTIDCNERKQQSPVTTLSTTMESLEDDAALEGLEELMSGFNKKKNHRRRKKSSAGGSSD